MPNLLQLLSSPSSNLRLSALELLARVCSKGGADAVASAGGATPLSFELVKSASVAKGWGGGCAADATAGERACAQLLTCLIAMPPPTVKDAFRAASATPALVALLGTADESIRSRAMALMERLAPSDGAQVSDDMVSTGGIALLCDNLLQQSQPEANKLQAMQTIASLSRTAANAVAIAETVGAVDGVFALLGRSPALTAAALTTLANLSQLGALRLAHFREAAALQSLSTAAAPDSSPDIRAAALICIAQAALDRSCRQGLARQGVPQHLVAAIGAEALSAEAVCHATQALAQFGAEEEYRNLFVGWGAIPPLCAQLTPAVQPDSRTRAMALSAIANISFVDAPSLIRAGAADRLVETLFDADVTMLRMSLTAISNLLRATDTEPAVVGQLLQSGAVHAIAALLNNPDAEISAQALTATVHACSHASLAAPLAEAGALPAVVGLLSTSTPAGGAGAIRALVAMCAASEGARSSAIEAGAIPALCTQLLALGEADARRLVVVTLSNLLRDDWQAILCGKAG